MHLIICFLETIELNWRISSLCFWWLGDMPCSGGICFLHHFDHFPLTVPDGAVLVGTGLAWGQLSAIWELCYHGLREPSGWSYLVGKSCVLGFTLVWVVHWSVTKCSFKCLFCLVWVFYLRRESKRLRVKTGREWIFLPLTDYFYL